VEAFLNVSAAYYRQSTTTIPAPVTYGNPGGDSSTKGISLDDRDVFLATIDACPIHLEYTFLSLIPCGTFSLLQAQARMGTARASRPVWAARRACGRRRGGSSQSSWGLRSR
jgi:hypothetical protein